MLKLFDFPRAVLHIDGDCFFASCEVAKNPSLRGKPVITGSERGIVSSLTYEAKAKGVKRAMSLWEVKKICPDAIFLPSDYETYSLFSVRMYEIVRRYTSDVEEYSIDECFADLTGLQRPLNMSYEKIAESIKRDLDAELGMTFSIGLAPTKVLAKIGSKWKKPSGLTIIRGQEIHQYLDKIAVDKVWGIGPQTTAYLNKLGVHSALDFAQKDFDWVKSRLSKPYLEIWKELNGEVVNDVDTARKSLYQSISKTKTFTPPSSDKAFILSQLSKNVENAFIKARRYKLATKKFFFYLKTQDFQYAGLEIKMNRQTASPNDVISLIASRFDDVFNQRQSYRASGIVLTDLAEHKPSQLDIFGEVIKSDKYFKIFGSVDDMAARYGKHTLFLGTSWQAMNFRQHQGGREAKADRKSVLFKGETIRKRLAIPMLGEAW